MKDLDEDFEIGRMDATAPDLEPLLMRNAEAMFKATVQQITDTSQVVKLIDPDAVLHVLRYKDIPVGFGAFRKVDDDSAEICAFHVMKELRGKGLARVILTHLMAELRQEGFSKATLMIGVQAGFIPARMLFASSGFVPCASPSAVQANSLMMSRDLTSH